MYSMKEACTLTTMTYENLKFYCNEGLVPNVKRDRRNYRVFDEHDIKWIQSLNCLKSCGMSIAEMKQYLALCMEGEGTIPERKVILAEKKKPCSNPLLNCKRQWHTLTGSRDSMTMCCQARQRITVILFRNCLSDISVQLTQQISIFATGQNPMHSLAAPAERAGKSPTGVISRGACSSIQFYDPLSALGASHCVGIYRQRTVENVLKAQLVNFHRLTKS